MATPHKHADILRQIADDAGLPIWYWHRHQKAWFSATPEMLFNTSGVELAVGEKPTAPPRKTCTLAGVEFPEPEAETPRMGRLVFCAEATGIMFEYAWQGDEADNEALRAGLIHLTREAGEQHSRALFAANRAAIEAAR